MTPDQIQLAIKAAVVAVVLAIAAGAGWMVNGWRLSGKINTLQGIVDTQVQSLATLEGANQRCTAGVEEVKGAVKGYVDAGTKRSEAAAEAMRQAAAGAQRHLEAARGALNRPPAPAGKECETVAAEASAYAHKRKEAP